MSSDDYKQRIGKGAYVWRLLSMLPGYDYAPFTLTIDGTPHEAVSAIIANGRFYAGRYVIAPDASLYEPVFQVCLFTRPGAKAVLSYGAALVGNRLANHPDVTIIEASEVDIEGAEGAPLQIDGDPGGTVPARVSVSSTSISVLHPA